jgi:uncharacterized protein (TIGR02284 family)
MSTLSFIFLFRFLVHATQFFRTHNLDFIVARVCSYSAANMQHRDAFLIVALFDCVEALPSRTSRAGRAMRPIVRVDWQFMCMKGVSMKNNDHILNDLIAVNRDGKSFYEQAANKVDNPSLKSLFTRIANVKSDIVQGLTNEAKISGDMSATPGTWTDDFNKLYGEVRPHLGDKNYAYVTRLEESENRLLKAFDKVLSDKDIPASARTVINRMVPEVHNCYELIQARKIELKKAA